MQWVEQTHNFGRRLRSLSVCPLEKKGPSRVQPSRMPQQEKVIIGNRPLHKLNEIKIRQQSEVRGKYKGRVHIVNSKTEREAHGS